MLRSMSLIGHTQPMSDKRKLDIGDLQASACRIIRETLDARGLSGRWLAEHADIGVTRCAAMLRLERVMTVDELDRICAALGFLTWQFVQEAQTRVPSDPGA